jgi:hypothetical protein
MVRIYEFHRNPSIDNENATAWCGLMIFYPATLRIYTGDARFVYAL